MEFALILLVAVLMIVIWRNNNSGWNQPIDLTPGQKEILKSKVSFYRSLNEEQKSLFETKVGEFLANTRITGIKTEVDDFDRMLVSASAIIPIFSFHEWRYAGLSEVLLYPGSFDENYAMEGQGRNILGMVGSGLMEGKMILSKPALHVGFQNETDKKNVAIHEFLHLIDKRDGQIDGIPQVLMKKQYVLPWLDLVKRKMQEIHHDKSDMNPYGGISTEEFFTVAGEYFFERPELMKKKHPELYEALSSVFDYRIRKTNFSIQKTPRNAPCPCGSGEKFKKCCG